MVTKSVLAREFPLTAEFRSGPRNGKASYEDWKDQQRMPEGHTVDLQTNILRFSPSNYEYANRFAREHPETTILSTWRAASGTPKGANDDGDPLGVSVIEFPGHWVVSPGGTLASSISSGDDRLTVTSGENMRKGPAILVEMDSSGNKKWDRFEYILITGISGNTLKVRREFNGSPEARNFPSRRTALLPMPWDDRNRKPYTDWFFNLSKYCPRDPQGRTAMDVIFEEMLEPLEKGGPLDNISGLDLASGPLTVNPSFADYNLDGEEDPDSFYRDGIETFYKRIRKTIGPEGILTTSLDYDFLDYINGVNQEGLAAPDDPWEDVAETVNEVLGWKRLAKLPMVSLAFQQHMDREEDLLRVQMSRLLNGYSVCLGLAADIETGSGSEALDAIKRIELYKGDEREPHWLGKTIGMKRPASMTPNLLGNGARSATDWNSMLPALSILRGDLYVDGNELVLSPWKKDFPGYVTLDLNIELEDKSDFTVFMEAKSMDDQIRRKILLPRVNVPVDTGPLRADITSKDYLPLSFYVRGAQRGSVKIDFRFAEGGDVRFRSLSVHAAADTLACEFEKGVVVVNPSLEDGKFDLTKIFPGRKGYRRLKASEPVGASDIPTKYRPQLWQAMELNNGQRIGNPKSVEVPQRNALFLIANAFSATGGAVDVPTIGPDHGTTDDEENNVDHQTSPQLKIVSERDCTTGMCSRCEGDCDRDSHCKGGLLCFKRNGYAAVPGCEGLGERNKDYCYDPMAEGSGGRDADESDPAPSPALELKMVSGRDCKTGMCSRCEGDCDRDSHCKGNLKCFKRNGFTAVPGCEGRGERNKDYCYDASTENRVGNTLGFESELPSESEDEQAGNRPTPMPALRPSADQTDSETAAPPAENANIFDEQPTGAWTSVSEDELPPPGEEGEEGGNPTVAALSDTAPNAPTLPRGKEISAIVGFALVISALAVGSFVLWQRTRTPRGFIRQINDEATKKGNDAGTSGGGTPIFGETVVDNASSDGDGEDGPDDPDGHLQADAAASLPRSPLPSPPRPSITVYAMKASPDGVNEVEVLRCSSSNRDDRNENDDAVMALA